MRFLPFREARRRVRKIKLHSFKEWLKWQRPDNIPSNPDVAYRLSGWKGYDDWLGKKPPRVRSGTVPRRRGNAKKFMPFIKARAYVRKLNLTHAAWLLWCRVERPLTIPSNPDKHYADWQGFGDWLATKRWKRKQNKGQ